MAFDTSLLFLGLFAAIAILYMRWPGYFHLRVAIATVTAIVSPRRLKTADEEIVSNERVWLGDVDFNIHMNNAVYNSLTDYARMTWFLRLGAPNVLASMGRVRVGNGGLTMYFIRELKPFQAFRLRTRLAGVDRKWFLFLHTFESGSPKKPVTHALGMTKIVFKEKTGPERGKTIPPRDLLARMGVPVPQSMAERDCPAAEPLHELLAELEALAGVEAALGAAAGARTPGPDASETPNAAAAGAGAGADAASSSHGSSASTLRGRGAAAMPKAMAESAAAAAAGGAGGAGGGPEHVAPLGLGLAHKPYQPRSSVLGAADSKAE